MMQLLGSVGASGEVFMRERVALLVSEVGLLQFPGEWPTMLEDFMTIWETQPSTSAIIGECFGTMDGKPSFSATQFAIGPNRGAGVLLMHIGRPN